MTLAYYNENDPFAARWLINLIGAGHIAPGIVDQRDIRDVMPCELTQFTQCHFFAGIGVWSHALRQAGWRDNEPIWTGSCPCQPFSAAGRGLALADERHLWPHWHHLIKECKPKRIAGEQVAGKAALEWFDLVSTDLEAEGYAVGASVIPAASCGAPHVRDRLWWFADAEWDEQRREEPRRGQTGRMGRIEQSVSWDRPWPTALAEFRVLDDGITRSVATTDAYRNAIVAPVATRFIEAVMSL